MIWVCHALTANSDAQDWWPNFIGENLTLDTEKYTIVCANILGSCYGTSFQKQEKLPLITIRDMVKLHQELAKFLQISEIELLSRRFSRRNAMFRVGDCRTRFY